MVSNIAGALSIPAVMGWYLAAIEGLVPLVPRGLSWLPIVLATIAFAALVTSAIAQHQIARHQSESKSRTTTGGAAPEVATSAAHSPRENQNGIDLEIFRRLVAVLERRYINHENPPAGRPLPDGWLQGEIGHLEMELYRQLLDEHEIDFLKLPFSRGTQTIENAQELTEYHSLIAGAWIRTEQEFRKTIESFRTLATTWFSFHPENPELLTFLPGTGNIRLTPEILANVQAQTKAAIQRFRLHVVMLETLLNRVVLADPREVKK